MPENSLKRKKPKTARTRELADGGFSGALYKTDAFMRTQPYGTVPAAFSPDGDVGVFESNGILRAVARSALDANGLYGRNAMDASRIDSFLDATLVFGREAQVYLLGIDGISHQSCMAEWLLRLSFIWTVSNVLLHSAYIAGDQVTIADIAFACGESVFT